VVPFAPGGTGEFLSRSITPRMGELIGQQFIVDFRGGAGTTLAAGLVATSAPDGYTVLIQTITTQAINHSLYAKLAYDTRKDFASVGLIAVIPVVLAAHPSLPARNAKELAVLTHARAGKIDFASTGIGVNHTFRSPPPSSRNVSPRAERSQFAGASRELPEALVVNPYDADQCAAALQIALTMPENEQRDRMRFMRGVVREFNVYRWAGRMLLDAAVLRQRERFRATESLATHV